ncbi:MAG: Obg family GTPase CgtA [Anaerolineae bacterium]
MLNGASEDPIADYSQINSELALYDENLADKSQIIVFNKMDLPEAQEKWAKIGRWFGARGIKPLAISALTRENVKGLIQHMFEMVQSLPESPLVPDSQMPTYDLPIEEEIFNIVREGTGIYRVVGKRIERAAAMTHWDYDDAIMRFQDILETLGVSTALEQAGVQVGDTVHIGDFELEWSD